MLHEQRRIGYGGLLSETAHQATLLARTVEEPVFLDEPVGVASPLRTQEPSIAFEMFPDEDYGKDPVSRTKGDRSPIRLFEVRTMATNPPVVQDAAPVGRIRPGVLLLFFIAAALVAFGTVRAFQVNGVTSVTFWQLFGR